MADEFICVMKTEPWSDPIKGIDGKFSFKRIELFFCKIETEISDINSRRIGSVRLTKDDFLEICDLETGVCLGEKLETNVPLRIKADHTKSCVFSSEDGAKTVVTTSPSIYSA